MIRLIYTLALFCCTVSVLGQDKDRKGRLALMLGADITSPVASLIEPGTTKYGGHANLSISNLFYFTFDYGVHRGIRQNAIGSQIFTHTNLGDYYILGFDYNLSRKKRNGATFLGFRYGVSRFTNRLEYTIQQPYWQSSKTTYSPKRTLILEATWVALVGGVRIQLVGPVYIGMTARIRVIRSLDESNPTTVELPGFGFLTSKTRATFTQYVFLKLGK